MPYSISVSNGINAAYMIQTDSLNFNKRFSIITYAFQLGLAQIIKGVAAWLARHPAFVRAAMLSKFEQEKRPCVAQRAFNSEFELVFCLL